MLMPLMNLIQSTEEDAAKSTLPKRQVAENGRIAKTQALLLQAFSYELPDPVVDIQLQQQPDRRRP